MGTPSISCRQFIDGLGDPAGDPLDVQARTAHEQQCPACARYRRNYEAAVALASSAGAAVTDEAPALPEDLARSILASRRRPG